MKYLIVLVILTCCVEQIYTIDLYSNNSYLFSGFFDYSHTILQLPHRWLPRVSFPLALTAFLMHLHFSLLLLYFRNYKNHGDIKYSSIVFKSQIRFDSAYLRWKTNPYYLRRKVQFKGYLAIISNKFLINRVTTLKFYRNL